MNPTIILSDIITDQMLWSEVEKGALLMLSK